MGWEGIREDLEHLPHADVIPKAEIRKQMGDLYANICEYHGDNRNLIFSLEEQNAVARAFTRLVARLNLPDEEAEEEKR